MAPFIVDAHEDIAFNALSHARDFRLSVVEKRAIERAHPPAEGGPVAGMTQSAMVGLPELRRGGVGLVFGTIFVSPGEAARMTREGLAQLDYYRELAAQNIGVRIVAARSQVDALLADWHAARDPATRPLGLVLLMEGADPLTDPAALQAWYDKGLRVVGPAWTRTRYCGGTHAPGPLTDLGRALMDEMARLGMILDVSHMAEESFWQALERFPGTVIASHANCRAFVPTDRQLSDEMIRALAARNAVIGSVIANRFLVDGWTEAAGPVTLEALVRHIDHVVQLTGSARFCALGSDFDGGFGVESTPVELDSVADLGKLGPALEAHGYSAADVEGILGGNWLRILHRGLPA